MTTKFPNLTEAFQPAAVLAEKDRRERVEKRLAELLTARFEDIKFADTKAGVIVTLAGVLATGVPALGTFTANPEKLGGLSLAIGLAGFVFAMVAISCAILAVRPRLNADGELENFGGIQYDDPLGNPFLACPWPRSRMPYRPEEFLGSTATASFRDAEELYAHHTTQDEHFGTALASELLRLSRIAHAKHRWIHFAITCALYEALFFLAFVALRLFVPAW